MDSRLRMLAARQADVVAAWQLRGAGWTDRKIWHHVQQHGWRVVHRGVYVLNNAPIQQRQLWFAAALTAPRSVLSHGSGGACYGFYRFERGYEVVTRPGQGGRQRRGGVVICRSKRLDGDTTRFMGIPITTAARVLIDLAPGLDERRLGRAFRESIRLKRTTARRVRTALDHHRGRPGTPLLRDLATRYATIPYHRTRSDPEGRGLEVLHDAGTPPPLVNEKVAGVEADMVWPKERRIIEIDGPQYHLFPEEDARKEEIWREAGYVVRRIPSDAVYHSPEELIALAP
jgi:hypothetical protein